MRWILALTVGLWLVASAPVARAQVVINELRIDQPGADIDEYVELAGPPGQPLDGLAYIVIGDGAPAAGSGVIEAVVRLDGFLLSDAGRFLIAEGSFTLGSPDLTVTLNFENDDNVTHLLVSGFTGANGQDLDLDDDGVLDIVPWNDVVDGIALIKEENPPTTTEFAYILDERVGPDGANVPGHVQRCPDPAGPPVIAAFDPAAGEDTPGQVNRCAPVVAPVALTIPAIQGAGHLSPFEAQLVTTRGVVTAVDTNGFFLQDPDGDGDVLTSDAILVFTGSRPTVRAGDYIEITASVAEFIPGGASTRNLSTTELVSPVSVDVLGTAPLPPAVVLGTGGRLPPTEIIDDDAFGAFDPASDGIDFFESLEGMRVLVQNALAVSPTNGFGEIFTVVDGGAGATSLSRRGTLNISPRDFNPERVQIQIDAGILDIPTPLVDVGARLGDITGVVGYNFGSFEVLVTEPIGAVVRSTLAPERTVLRSLGSRLRIATFNVLNLDPNDADGDTDVADGRFDAIARIIAQNLRAPEIIGLQEIQDNDGSARSDVTAADRTLQMLTDAIVVAGGPRYRFVDNPFIGNGASGGQPGGNIRVAYLYDPKRVRLIESSVATITDPVAQQNDPSSPFFATRLPLVATFRRGVSTLTVVNVHLSSKGGSAPLFGSLQPSTQLQELPAVNGSVDARRNEALAVADFVADALDADPGTNLVVLGDFNEFEFVSPLAILGESLMNLTWTLPEDERYTFIFDGNSQSLDHILVTPRIGDDARVDIVHVNTEFADTDARASDHDPIVARIKLRPSLRSLLSRLGHR
jgi:hypothetical protein